MEKNIINEFDVTKTIKLQNLFLAITHFFISILYVIQQLIIIRNGIIYDDQMFNSSITNLMTYISIGISIILIVTNLIAGIGIIRWRNWAWWISASYFLYLGIQKIITFLYGIYTYIFLLGFPEDRIFLSQFDGILNSLYIVLISIMILLFLYNEETYYNYKKSSLFKKKNFFISGGVAVVIIFLNIILSAISNLLA